MCGAGYIPLSSFPVVALNQIANRWSHELQGTPQEKSPEDLLAEMTAAISKAVAGAVEKISRDEFLRLADKLGYPRPKFWDSEPAAVGTRTAPAAAKDRLLREAPTRERVKSEMRAAIETNKYTIDALVRNKESWVKEFGCGSTTAYEAARELAAELNQKK